MDHVPALVTTECAGSLSAVMHPDIRSVCTTWTADRTSAHTAARGSQDGGPCPPERCRSPPHTLQETACRGIPIPSIGIQLPQDEDDQLMKCRWVRQAIHAELDSIREGFTATGESLPVDFEVAGDDNFVD